MEKRKPLPPTYFNSSIFLIILIHFIVPVKNIISFPWNLLGIIPVIIGAVLNLMADREFKLNKTTVKPFEESSSLITTGVFKISRNPMYLGMVLVLIGISIFLGSVTPYVVVILFTVLINVLFIKNEEKMLAETFGDSWLEYKKKTRRWL
ncbi:MAG: isoprenylcysteine carboxylmethyltransferase family protein [Calditrichaceae bacterium]